jgi:hypothetical protein
MKYYKDSRRRKRTSYHSITRRKLNWIGYILRRNCLLKHVIEGKKRREDDEEDLSSYWMTLRNRKYTGN